ncbi:hypothetical protein AB1Y20_018251 [Prymnesium parvum]|uniref:ubiquitinyl hydrolase 1 n=1 Tax=Prymnesium parvum TaxID=97485 RepID=A0AB34JMW1_PRYPA
MAGLSIHPPLEIQLQPTPPGASEVQEPQALLGLRGLTNLGNTCFMSCVLQIFMHCPPMARFFLSDRHNRFECMARSLHDPSSGRHHVCLACEMDLLFSQCFSGAAAAFSPHSFLHTMWLSSDRFAGYEQQDAHEFFIAALAAIYDGLRRPANERRLTMESKRARLVASSSSDLQAVFHGSMRSDVICARCGGRSTTMEDFTDISLDLPLSTTASSEGSCVAKDCSLEQCLHSFTRVEQLGADERCTCTSCGGLQDSAKQLSIHKLPHVLCVHLKRFKGDYKSNQGKSSKLDGVVKFPLHSLDMSPHTAAHICADNAASKELIASNLYDLFGAAVHHGTMQNGHYTAYVRHQAHWFHCDDSCIYAVPESAVRACSAYMLFYVQKRLN